MVKLKQINKNLEKLHKLCLNYYQSKLQAFLNDISIMVVCP